MSELECGGLVGYIDAGHPWIVPVGAYTEQQFVERDVVVWPGNLTEIPVDYRSGELVC